MTKRKIECVECNGEGVYYDEPTDWADCERCDGSGEVEADEQED